MEHILVRCVANFPFSEDAVEAAASTYSGDRILELLIRYRGESLPITEDVVKAAAMNYESYHEDWGLQTMGVLLKHGANDLPISEDVVKAAAANLGERGYKITRLLTQHRGDSSTNRSRYE